MDEEAQGTFELTHRGLFGGNVSEALRAEFSAFYLFISNLKPHHKTSNTVYCVCLN